MILKIEHLSKAYGNRVVLEDINFELPRGEVYGLLGPNGAGKTTTINILCHLQKPDSGTIIFNNQPLSEKTKSLIGVAPQENLLYPSLTCAENLHFFGKIYGLGKRERQRQVQTCLEAVNLEDRHNSLVETLSGGMKRRLNIAIALIHNPPLVILDEPTAGLDIEARYEIWELMRYLKEQGITILLTTHLLDEAEKLCHRIGILKEGKIIADGSLADLRKRVPAAEIVIIESTDKDAVITRAHTLGFTPRWYGNELALWLPKALELKEIIHQFDGIPLDSIARQPVRLEHIYLELTSSLL